MGCIPHSFSSPSFGHQGTGDISNGFCSSGLESSGIQQVADCDCAWHARASNSGNGLVICVTVQISMEVRTRLGNLPIRTSTLNRQGLQSFILPLFKP